MGVGTKEGLNAKLALEDGTVLAGYGFGFPTRRIGEVVFNTGMVGYTESLTDPSYRGQILCFTYPLIGNYGVPDMAVRDEHGLPMGFESESLQVLGVIVQEVCEAPNHWMSKISLNEWLKRVGIPGISGIDTRELTKKLRVQGVMMGALDVSTQPLSNETLIETLRSSRQYGEISFVKEVTVERPIEYGDGDKVVVILDCGVKLSIIRELLHRGAKVIRLPYDTSASDVLNHRPAGVVISNGPGDPQLCTETIKTVRALFERGVPILGICLGTQILALALGGTTFKLKYGHRGQNKPCVVAGSLRSYVTSQNHGYAVDTESISGTGLQPWFVNADDQTVEGFRHENGRCISVQFHPEASPGPYDTRYVFDEFDRIIRGVSQ